MKTFLFLLFFSLTFKAHAKASYCSPDGEKKENTCWGYPSIDPDGFKYFSYAGDPGWVEKTKTCTDNTLICPILITLSRKYQCDHKKSYFLCNATETLGNDLICPGIEPPESPPLRLGDDFDTDYYRGLDEACDSLSDGSSVKHTCTFAGAVYFDSVTTKEDCVNYNKEVMNTRLALCQQKMGWPANKPSNFTLPPHKILERAGTCQPEPRM